MAGAGWREWVAGEQLTDAKMQTYLMDQSVMRFANASARTSALTGVVSEGMITYLDDLNVVEVWDGSAFVELTGDPDIFTQGTAGQFLRSLGTAGVEWSAGASTPTAEGVVYGETTGQSGLDQGIAALGYEAGLSTTQSGVFIGAAAGYANTTGARNTFVGEWAGVQNTTGTNNTAMGRQAMASNTTGSSNVAIGYLAATSPTGSERTIVGAFAGGNGVGDGNTFIGYGVSLGQSVTGTNNTIVGRSAGNLSSGSNNLILGNTATASAATVSNEITLGNSSISALRCQVTSISSLSDERDKTDVVDLDYGVDFLNRLRPVSFVWDMRDGAKVGEKDFGFIAQELAAVEDDNDADLLKLTLRSNPDKLEATPGRLIPILVKAIQELSARVEELENAR